MRAILLYCTLLAFVFCAPAGSAEELPSCDDLTEMANALDEVADEVAASGRIKEGSQTDKDLREIIDALLEIAKVEEDGKLTKSVKNLEAAWEKMDWKAFVKHLEEVSSAFDKIYRRDCK